LVLAITADQASLEGARRPTLRSVVSGRRNVPALLVIGR